ncbi:MAG TPA: SRPBCC family protein [Actinotalea sp.]
MPIHEIQERWIRAFDRPRLATLSRVRRRAEDLMSDKPAFVYVTYVESTPEAVWTALTDADVTASYWGHSNVSDWQTGSAWEHRRTDGSGTADVVGRVLESSPPRRLVTTWAMPGEESDEGASRVTFDIEPYGSIVRLTVTHEGLADDTDRRTAAHGWAAVMSNLKSLLETGHVLPTVPWEMPPASAGGSSSPAV